VYSTVLHIVVSLVSLWSRLRAGDADRGFEPL